MISEEDLMENLTQNFLKLEESKKTEIKSFSEKEKKVFDLHGECSGDPQGYFIIKGTEKVVLMQEQLCRNKVLMEPDWKKGIIQASCASATLETKSKIGIVLKNNRLWLKSSSFKELISLPIIFKAMGCEGDRLITRLLNIVEYNNSDLQAENDQKTDTETTHRNQLEEFSLILYLSFEETNKLGVVSQKDAISYLANKIRYLFKSMENKSKEEKMIEVINILSKIVLPHVSVKNEDFKHKITFIAYMTRKLFRFYFKTKNNKSESEVDIADNRDYLGNKRVECAGEMLSLLFEDLFKRFNSELKKELDKFLLRAKRKARDRDSIQNLIKTICSSDTITNGLKHALSSGNWTIKRSDL